MLPNNLGGWVCCVCCMNLQCGTYLAAPVHVCPCACKFMNMKLNEPLTRYLRVVYWDDMVPRMPYDNKMFLFKHFGVCLYYNSCYKEKVLF